MKRTDANQVHLVKLAKQLGCSVQCLSNVGHGCPDYVLGIFGVNLLVEFKDGSKPPSARKLTDRQIKWHSEWKGQKAVIATELDLEKVINMARGHDGRQL